MKRCFKVLVASLCVVSVAYGYCKYRYFDYDYKLTDEGRQHLVDRITRGCAPFGIHKADYAFVDNKGVFYTCVMLNRADRRHLRKLLSGFDRSSLITDEMITSFCIGGSRMKHKIVGWVLRDFKAAHNEATVGQVLNVVAPPTLDARAVLHE